MMRGHLPRILRPLLLAVAVGFIGYLVHEVGPATIWDAIRTLSWRLLVVLCFPYALVATLDTLGWRFAFRRSPAPFAVLFRARLAGEAVNLTTPTASVGGEPVKAYLLRPHVPLAEAFAAVIVDKTTLVVGQGLFLLIGLLLAPLLVPLSTPIMTGMAILLTVEALAVGGFVYVQLRGVFGGGGRLLGRFGLVPGARYQAGLDDVDRALALLYHEHADRLVLSMLCHLLGYLAGSLEIYLVLNFLGLPVSPLTALVVESFGTGIKFASFMIPGSLGALEGGNVAIFAAFGLGGALGLTYTLIRRLREAAWASVGLSLLAALGARTAPIAARGPGEPPVPLC
jgi:putative membrane protein